MNDEKMYRRCKYTLTDGCYKAMKRDKDKAQNKIAYLQIKYPYENFQRYFASKAYYYGARKGNYVWQECEDAAMMAYMYGVGRCAAEGYDYIENYVKKMGRIYMKCALIIHTFENGRAICIDDVKIIK